MHNATEEFKNAMRDAGITPPDAIIGDSLLHRFKIDNKLNGAYVLHLDRHPAGYFQDFKQGIKVRWKLSGDYKPLTDAEHKAYAIERMRQTEQRQAKELAKHDAAKLKAAAINLKRDKIRARLPYFSIMS